MMRRVFLPLVLVGLLLTACGGGTVDLATAVPPNASVVQQTGNAEIDAILSSWRESVPSAMIDRAIKGDTIQQNVYTTDATVTDVQNYYVTTFEGKNGWSAAMRTPGLDAEQGVAIDGYEHGTTSLIIGAIDAAKYGGEGTVVYTVTGHK